MIDLYYWTTYPWIVRYKRQGQKLEDFADLKHWFEAMHERPWCNAPIRGPGESTARRRGAMSQRRSSSARRQRWLRE
jgi:hypothetical protein